MMFSYFFILWAMWTNNFFSSRVRIQTDRGQYVVQEGPYSFVRHPGYLGVLFWQPSIPLSLGSLWGLIPACLAVISIIIRTYLEDRMLQKELPGYSDYTRKVRYRLIRGIW
jgi:protein-S-isoprenylcysteine O-methyltransferase Ste14